jgi:hypothetical protein
VHLLENLAKALNISFEKKNEGIAFSSSMQQALDDERNGRVTKLINPRNAVAEIVG